MRQRRSDMDNFEIILRGKGSDISSDFHKPITIPTDFYQAKIGVKNFSTYNNIPNIVEGVNNRIKIKVPGNDYRIFKLETGAYELSVIAKHMVNWIQVTYPKLEKVEENFALTGNKATSKAEFLFKDDYGIDFEVEGSMNDLLGFNKKDYFKGIGLYAGKRIVNITNVTQLIFNCNITTSNFINGKEMPFIYSCGVDVPAGYRLSRELTDISYKNLNTTAISHIRVWIVDEFGLPINLRKDDLTVTLKIIFVPLVTKVAVE